MEAGTAALPSACFWNDVDTGFYRAAENQIGVATNGANIATFSTTGLAVAGTLSATGATSFAVGSAAAPSVTFTGDTDTGVYHPAANQVGISSTGALAALIEATAGAPAASATKAVLTLGGTAMSGGSTSGTYFGLNAATAYAGNLVDLKQNALSLFTIASANAAVNGINIACAATGNGGTLGALGSDTNIALNLASKGTGNVVLKTGTTTAITIGNAAAPASVGTTPGTNAATLISATGAVGGATSIATTGVGGVGGGVSLTGGAGGVAAAAATASTGGVGGAIDLTAGAGGAANDAANLGTNIGGVGGAVNITSGSGGAAANGTDTGGVGGAILIYAGPGGSGDTGGVGGAIYLAGGAAGAGGGPAAGDIHLGSNVAGTSRGVLYLDTNVTVKEAMNVVLGTTTGTKLGTGATQKLGFWGLTPAVQPVSIADATGSGGGDAHTQLNLLLASLRTIGIIAAPA